MPKRLLLPLFMLLQVAVATAQETPEKIMEERTRELYRVITVADKAQWKKFVQENYTQALIDKPSRFSVQVSDDGTSSTGSSQEITADTKLEAKAKVFSQLHDDFGDSVLSSIKIENQTGQMILKSPSGLSGTFKLTFEKSKPYKIDGLSIEAGN